MKRIANALLSLMIAALCLGLAVPVEAQWPQFGGLTRDFRAADPAPPAAGLGTWSLDLGTGDAAPIVDQGRIFVTEASFSEDGQERMQVRCLRPLDGGTIWSTSVDEKSDVSQDINDNYPVRPLASPLAAGNRIVVVSFGGCVTCLDQSTGEVLWKHDLVSEFAAPPLQFGWASSPWSNGSLVVVPCGGPQGLLIAFDLETGKTAWRASPGEAAYGSLAEWIPLDGSKQLCYLGRDALVGVDPVNGQELWTYPLPNPGRTNAVTPIPLDESHLLVGGQGLDSLRKLKITKANAAWTVEEIWQAKPTPFYCNCLTDLKTDQAFSYQSNVLSSVSLETGKSKWKVRGWTDANFAFHGDQVVGIRGDGFLATAILTGQGLTLQAGARVVNDRVWAPPVVVGNSVLLRGRRTLSAVNLSQLRPLEQLPSGTEIDSMKAMYGEQHEVLVRLLDRASTAPGQFEYEDYSQVIADRSIRFGEAEYRSLLKLLSKAERTELVAQIAEDWMQREPNSIVAFDELVAATERLGQNGKAVRWTEDRLVAVVLDVVVPDNTDPKATIYLAGNASAVGSWNPAGVLLKRGDDGHYRGQLSIPRGQLEFKITQGTWDTAEAREDGRIASNRRRLIKQPVTISVQVAGWTKPAKK